MAQLLGFSLLSLVITGILIIPFIDFLYKIKLRRQKQSTVDLFNKPTPLFDKFNGWKVGTPFGGGLLIIVVSSILFLWSFGILSIKINLLHLFVLQMQLSQPGHTCCLQQYWNHSPKKLFSVI